MKNVMLKLFIKSRIPVIYSIYKLEKEKKNCISLDDFIDLAYDFNRSFPFRKLNITPIQVRSEVKELLLILQKHNPKKILEIGTANGGTLFLFCQVTDRSGTIISVDLPEINNIGGYPEYRKPIYESFIKNGQNLHLIKANSHDPKTVTQIEKILQGDKLDFLFIDGDNSYAGVKQDYENYYDFVKVGGLIALHDIVKNDNFPQLERYIFWDEIKGMENASEIIFPMLGFDSYYGIGVIKK